MLGTGALVRFGCPSAAIPRRDADDPTIEPARGLKGFDLESFASRMQRGVCGELEIGPGTHPDAFLAAGGLGGADPVDLQLDNAGLGAFRKGRRQRCLDRPACRHAGRANQAMVVVGLPDRLVQLRGHKRRGQPHEQIREEEFLADGRHQVRRLPRLSQAAEDA